MINVQFTNSAQNVIKCLFGSPQDPDIWSNQGLVEEDDPRYIAFIAPNTDSTERLWRDTELVRADEELNKVQDADPKAVGTVTQWREYRRVLRQYPETEGFSSGIRPVSPK